MAFVLGYLSGRVMDSKGHKQRVTGGTYRIVKIDLRKLWSWTTTGWGSQRIFPFARGDFRTETYRTLMSEKKRFHWRSWEQSADSPSFPQTGSLRVRRRERWDRNRQTGKVRYLHPCATSRTSLTLNQSQSTNPVNFNSICVGWWEEKVLSHIMLINGKVFQSDGINNWDNLSKIIFVFYFAFQVISNRSCIVLIN